MTFWWLSFCDPENAEGSQFMGGCIVPGRDMLEAVRVSYMVGCNPGGDVLGVQLPEEIVMKSTDICRLMDKAEAENFKP